VVDALPRLLEDQSYEAGRLFACSSLVTSIENDNAATAAFRNAISRGSALRRSLKARVLEGALLRLVAALRGISRLDPSFEKEVAGDLGQRELQRVVADKVWELQVPQLVVLLKWAYRVEPNLAGYIEREVVGAVRVRMAAELAASPASVQATVKGGLVSPVLDDLIRAARGIGDGTQLRWKRSRPFGMTFDKVFVFETDPLSALSDPLEAFAFIERAHPSRRRSIAAKSIQRAMGDVRNLQQIVDTAWDLPIPDLAGLIRSSSRLVPELSAALRIRLSDEMSLENLIDSNLGNSHPSEFAGLLSALRSADPRVHAKAVQILSTPERASLIAERTLAHSPAGWIGLLREPLVARSVLRHVTTNDWAEFWSCLPPEFPHWSRALQQLLRSYRCESLEQAPAEYILLGTGPDQWSPKGNVALRDISNALYCGGPLGEGIALRFLHRIEHGALVDCGYREESLWAIAAFVRAIYSEQSPAILKRMITTTLIERLRDEERANWCSSDLADKVGFLALVGAMALAGMEVPLRSARFGSPAPAEVLAASHDYPEGPALVEAGLRRLSLT
jgi:hypothetical protein